jgi:hypothetical protein
MTSRRLEIFTDERVCCAATRSVIYAGLLKLKAPAVDVRETSIKTVAGAVRAKRLGISKFPTVIIDDMVRVEPPLTPAAVAAAFVVPSAVSSPE